ncbi:MAG: TnpV protein [Clostridium sp.]
MEGIAGIQYREMNGVQIPVLEGVMSEEKMLASLNRYGRIAAQEMKRTDQAQYEMMLLSGKLMERLMKIRQKRRNTTKTGRKFSKTWTRRTG